MTEPRESREDGVVLAVDDNDANRYAVSRMLRLQGFSVREAASGLDALRLARERPDLILLDVRLPDLDGFEVCRRIRSDPAISDIPVLQISASYIQSEHRARGLDGGADAYITHPVEPGELIATVKALMRAHRAERRLRLAAQKWRRTFDAIGDAIGLLNADTRVTRCNLGFLQMAGLEFAEVLGTPLRTVFPELDEVTSDLLRGLHARREQLVRELWIRGRWFRLTIDPDLRSAEPAAVCVLTDLTDRKRAEQALEDSERRTRRILDSITESYMVLDREWRVTDANPRAESYLGKTRDEMLGRVFWELFPDAVGSEFDRRYYRAIAEQAPAHFEAIGMIRPVWLEVHAYPASDGLAVYFRDITERKRAEEELRRSEETFRLMANAMPQMVWTTDPAGEVTYRNPRWTEYFGRDFEDSTTEERQLTIHADDHADAIVARYREGIAGGEPFDIEYRLRRHDGLYRWHLVRCVPVRNADGAILKWIGTVTDIEDQKRATQRSRFLADAIGTLNATRNLEEALARVATRAVPDFADACTVDLVAPGGGIHRVAAAHVDPRKTALMVDIWRRHRMDPEGPHPVATAIRTGKASFHPEPTSDLLDAVAVDAEHLEMLRREDFCAAVAAPIVAHGHARGAISFWRAAGSPALGEEDLALAEELGARAGLALENSMLLDDLEITAWAEREQAARLRGLAEAVVAINMALSMEETIHVLTERARQLVRARWCLCSLTLQGGEVLSAVSRAENSDAWSDYHERPGSTALYQLVVRENRTIRLSEADLEGHEALRRVDPATGERSPMRGWLAAPLTGADGSCVGVIQLSDREGGDFTPDDEAVLLQLAQVASAAIENARLYHATRSAEDRVREHASQLELRVRERTAELAEAMEQLEAFSHSVAHNLRAPLRAMQGFAEAILDEYGERLDAEGRDYGRRIANAAHRMDGLIQDMLAYSRLGRMDLRSTNVDFAGVVTEAVARLDSELKKRDAQVRIEEPLPQAMGNHAMVVQVVANLLHNAAIYVAPHLQPKIRVRGEERERWVRLWVEDNGIGIAPKYHERIFGVFERLHGGHTFPGNGIGLAIVRKATERMGGRAGVESEPGRGSRFWIELPRVEPRR